MVRLRTPRFLLPSVALAVVLTPAACRSSDAAPGGPKVRPSAASAPEARTQTRSFGAPLTPAPDVLPISALLSSPDAFASKTVTVEAQVRRNCTKKGCWMEIAEGNDLTTPGCRVTFKDYGFFVPLDSSGARARVQGIVEVKTVAPGEAQHLEAEGARFAGKQTDGSARELRIVATGVELTRSAG
jgi:hypothetical protein